ncbi:MAG TPA: hypothetical protein VIJ75_10635 [Hanamia sp.]
MVHVNFHCLDHPFYTLLAVGYFGFGIVSCFLVTYSSLQITWYSGGWSFWFTKKHHHAARQITSVLVLVY